MIRNSQRNGELIRQARKGKRWSQADLAKHLGYGQAWVAHLETGRLKNISEDTYKKLTHIFRSIEHKKTRNLDNVRSEETRMTANDAATESVPAGDSHRTTVKNQVGERKSEGSHKLPLSVEGPWEIPHEKGPGGYRLLPKSYQGRRQDMLSEKGMSKDLQTAKGIYIFAIKLNGLYLPIYVGKAVKQGFGKECFTDRNQNLFKEGLADHEHGIPVMFFIVPPKKRGTANGKIIANIEHALITVAWLKNPNLVNTQYARRNWSITGVTGNGRCQASEAARALMDTLGLSNN